MTRLKIKLIIFSYIYGITLLVTEAFCQGIDRNEYSGIDNDINSVVITGKSNLKAAEFLEIPASARGMALGNAFSAVGDDVNTIWWNPAGLAYLTRAETSVSHLNYNHQFGMDYTFAAAGIPIIRNKLTLGAFFGYFDYRDFEITSISQPTGTGEIAKFFDYQAGGSLSYRILKNLSLGFSLKRVHLDMGAYYKANALALDAGALYRYSYSNHQLSLSISVQNYGTDFGSERVLDNDIDLDTTRVSRYGFYKTTTYQLPGSVAFGLGYQYQFAQNYNILASVEYCKPKEFLNSYQSLKSLGMEFNWPVAKFLKASIRAGWLTLEGMGRLTSEGAGRLTLEAGRQGENRTESRLGCGFDFTVAGRSVRLDYARNIREGIPNQDFLTLSVGI